MAAKPKTHPTSPAESEGLRRTRSFEPISVSMADAALMTGLSAATIRAATLDLIQDGVLAGLRDSTQRLLKQAKDLDAGIQKALDFEGVFTRLKEFQDPLGSALDAVDKEFTRLIRLFGDAGATARTFAALDFTNENERIAALRAELAEIDTALDRAETARRETVRLLGANRGPDGPAVADALIGGADVLGAVALGRTDEELRQEQASLRAAIGELNDRAAAVRDEIKEIQAAALASVADCSKPLADAIAEDMRDAAERLIEGYAAIAALSDAMKGHHGDIALAGRIAVDALHGMNKLLPDRRTLDVPPAMVEALQALQGKGDAIPVRVPLRVPAPR